MINLLPTDIKKNMSFARRNIRLARWSVALLVGIAGIWLIVAFGLFYLNRSTNSYSQQVAKTKQDLEDQKLGETQQEVENISSSLKLVIQVLGREVLFSKLLKQIGSVIPANASLTDLKIGKVEGAIDLTAVASDYNTATQVQVNLQDPSNKIFDKADIVSINCNSNSTSDPRYPCTINIRAQFSKNNPFLFINPAGDKKS